MNNQENNKILYLIGGVVIGVIVIMLVGSTTGYGYRGMMSWGNNRGIDNPQSAKGSSIDRHFIEQMIPHHEGAIDMAELALQKSKRSEVKVLSEAIIAAQNAEIADMTTWYKSWFGKNIPNKATDIMGGGMMSGGGMHMGGQEDMSALETATDFDKAFIEQMIPHHQLAIMMAQMLRSGSNRPEMLTLADNIIESQSKEIEQMQNLYQAWYK